MPPQDAMGIFQQALTRLDRHGDEPEVWIRFPKKLGDVVFALPFVGALQRQWNQAAKQAGVRLRWVAVGHRGGAALFSEANPDFFAEAVIETGGLGKPDPWLLLRRWKQKRPIAVINLSKSVRLVLAAFMTKVPIRAGILDNHLDLLYHFTLKYWKMQGHSAVRYKHLLRQLTGKDQMSWLKIGPETLGGERVYQTLQAFGWGGEPFVTLNFGTPDDFKRWFPERETWPALARLLLQHGFKVVWNGGPAEVALGAELAALVPGSWDLTGRTNIPEGIALQSLAYGNVAIDTGLSHTSAAIGRPTVVLFGPTHEQTFIPVGPNVATLRGCPVDLQPDPAETTAGYGDMHRITPERVLAILQALAT